MRPIVAPTRANRESRLDWSIAREGRSTLGPNRTPARRQCARKPVPPIDAVHSHGRRTTVAQPSAAGAHAGRAGGRKAREAILEYSRAAPPSPAGKRRAGVCGLSFGRASTAHAPSTSRRCCGTLLLPQTPQTSRQVGIPERKGLRSAPPRRAAPIARSPRWGVWSVRAAFPAAVGSAPSGRTRVSVSPREYP